MEIMLSHFGIGMAYDALNGLNIHAQRLHALNVTMVQRSELDYLIYNDPLAYADLILNGEPEKYLKNVTGSHRLEI